MTTATAHLWLERQRSQQVHGAIWPPITRQNQGLRGQIQDNVGVNVPKAAAEIFAGSHVAVRMSWQTVKIQLPKQRLIFIRRVREADNLGPHLLQPQHQPTALEPGMPGQQHAFATPEGGIGPRRQRYRRC
ncbi:MAG: hypothetical protein AAGA87_16100 [Pseudomonadota bacterium]